MLFDPDKPSNPFVKGCLVVVGFYAVVAAGLFIINAILKIGSP